MTPTTEAFEALMPEPTATVDADGFLVVLIGGYIPTHAKLYTADQLRTAMQAVWDAATERAAKQCEELGNDLSRIWRGGKKVDSHLEGQSDGCFDCAAAIRGTK